MRFDKEYSEYMHGKCKNYNQGLFEALEEMEKEGEGKMGTFDEHSEKAKDIMIMFEIFCIYTKVRQAVNFKEPYHDTARRFLNEIIEFKPIWEEEG